MRASAWVSGVFFFTPPAAAARRECPLFPEALLKADGKRLHLLFCHSALISVHWRLNSISFRLLRDNYEHVAQEKILAMSNTWSYASRLLVGPSIFWGQIENYFSASLIFLINSALKGFEMRDEEFCLCDSPRQTSFSFESSHPVISVQKTQNLRCWNSVSSLQVGQPTLIKVPPYKKHTCMVATSYNWVKHSHVQ